MVCLLLLASSVPGVQIIVWMRLTESETTPTGNGTGYVLVRMQRYK